MIALSHSLLLLAWLLESQLSAHAKPLSFTGLLLGLCCWVSILLLSPAPQSVDILLFCQLNTRLCAHDFYSLTFPRYLLDFLLLAGLASQTSVAHLTMALATCLVLWIYLGSLRRLYQHVRKKAGLGLGDVYLVGIYGIWLGLEYTLYVIILACLLTCCVSFGRASKHPQPFGPALSLMGILAYLWLQLGPK